MRSGDLKAEYNNNPAAASQFLADADIKDYYSAVGN